METMREVLTPEQAADYLQVNKETVYRYIRSGKLAASKFGRTYRIPKRSIELLLWETRTRPDLKLRDYTSEQIEQFILDDQLSPEQQAIADRFQESMDQKSARRTQQTAPSPAP